RRLKIETDFFVRTAPEWTAVIAKNPFSREARSTPQLLHVQFLKEPVARPALGALKSAIKGPEAVEAVGRHAYIFYPDGAGRSKLSPAMLAKHLGSAGTSRNWNTVLKLSALAGRD